MRLKVVLLFLGPGLEAANVQVLLGMIAWCRGPYYFDFFLKEIFLLVELNSLPVHGVAFCSLDTLPADDGELTILLALI